MDDRKIYLDPDDDGVCFEPKDWKLRDGPFITHVPTYSTFEIGCDTFPASIFEVSSRLSHVCAGHAAPEGAELTTLGHAAIAVALIAMGCWNPKVTDVPEKPKARKPAYPKYVN